jgi:hypothetical protein
VGRLLPVRRVTESFATPAEQRKVEREIQAFRRYRQLERSFIEVNEKICPTISPTGVAVL